MKNREETRIQTAIRESLGTEKDLLLMRNNRGVAKFFDANTSKERVVEYGLLNGSADLVGVLAPCGRWFCLEVKIPGKTADKDQVKWGNLIKRLGGFYCVVTSVEEARNALDRARRGLCE